MGIIFAFIFAIVFFSMNNFLPTIYMDINDINNFDDNQAVLVIASKLLLIAAMLQISDSIQVVILGAFKGS